MTPKTRVNVVGRWPAFLLYGVRHIAVCLVMLLVAVAAQAKEPVAIFHVGNSLTDQAYGMHDIAKARGHETKFGRHMIPGAPLEWLWNHRAEGFRCGLEL